MKIYVVTQGCYSDYHIITTTTDEEKAKKIAAKFDKRNGWDECRVEVYDDEENVVYERPLWRVNFDRFGNVKDIYEDSNDDFSYRKFIESPIQTYGNAVMRVFVTADTEEAAIKIAAEKRGMWLANKEGLC